MMGVAGLRDAFNTIASPRYTATMAFLSMEQAEGKEWSRLLFRGIGADGAMFEVASERVPASADVLEVARATAATLIEKGSG